MDNSKIGVSGAMDINIKIVNLSSSSTQKRFLDFHQQKSSKVFDSYNSIGFDSVIPLNPNTGKSLGKKFSVAGKVDIDFNFISEAKSLDNIDKGDVVLLLVDKLKNVDGRDILGKTGGGKGHVYAIEIDAFNQFHKVDTHEKGHLIGNMVDIYEENKGHFLMGHSKDGKGYRLRRSDSEELILNLIYTRALSKRGLWGKNHDTKQTAQDFIRDFVEDN